MNFKQDVLAAAKEIAEKAREDSIAGQKKFEPFVPGGQMGKSKTHRSEMKVSRDARARSDRLQDGGAWEEKNTIKIDN